MWSLFSYWSEHDGCRIVPTSDIHYDVGQCVMQSDRTKRVNKYNVINENQCVRGKVWQTSARQPTGTKVKSTSAPAAPADWVVRCWGDVLLSDVYLLSAGMCNITTEPRLLNYHHYKTTETET